MKKFYLLPLLLICFSSFVSGQKTNEIEQKTLGLKKFQGYFNFYWDEKTGHILLEVDKINTEFLYVNSLPAGIGSNDLGLDRGQIGGSRIVKFIRSGPKVLLVQPNYDFRAISGDSDECDHSIPAQADHPFRAKLTRAFRGKLTTPNA